MKWFDKIDTIDVLRKTYKDLVRTHHPDNGGNLADIQAINSEYDTLFKDLKEKHYESVNVENETDKQKQAYSWEKDKNIREMVLKLSKYPITIEIVGVWIWVSNCYEYRKELKNIGLHWAAKKSLWYFHYDDYHKFSKKSMNMDHIRMKYGSETVNVKQEKAFIKG
ncbi:hypothetical protein [[Clostridium] fimetarium]|uniref:J domain-containing protein n=1 Tax=[Clostridium] fimetarium TaxID=99656 RepID=A0A1I0QVT4_9FIRM|nr:hypothetical protein [[Clostridium] fimetarium]SEW31807.1 hypothetical protein SAMN05421659_109185 [[Clostridium] fimetarium]